MDIDKLVDSMIAVSRETQRQHKITEKKRQIASLSFRCCGNCALWMTRGCEPEQKSKRIRSMNDPACGLFDLKRNDYLLGKFEAELAELEMSQSGKGE